MSYHHELSKASKTPCGWCYEMWKKEGMSVVKIVIDTKLNVMIPFSQPWNTVRVFKLNRADFIKFLLIHILITPLELERGRQQLYSNTLLISIESSCKDLPKWGHFWHFTVKNLTKDLPKIWCLPSKFYPRYTQAQDLL